MTLKMTTEISLVTRLLVRGKEIPEKMKAKALEQISLMLMEYEEGDAFWYILDELYKSIEHEDRDSLEELAELALHTLEKPGSEDYSRQEFAQLEELCIKASHAFIEEQDSGARAAMVYQLTKDDLVMMYYADRFLLFYCNRFKGFIAAGVNGCYSKDQLVGKLDTMPADVKANIMSLIHRAFEIDVTEIKFADLSYDLYADGQVMIKLQEV